MNWSGVVVRALEVATGHEGRYEREAVGGMRWWGSKGGDVVGMCTKGGRVESCKKWDCRKGDLDSGGWES